MATAEIWHRKFTRVSGPDTDTLMDENTQKELLKDKFGKFLQQESHSTLNTFDSVVSYYYDQSRLPTPTCRLRLFVVADGAHVDRSELPGNPDEWFNPHCRLLAVVDFENISTEPDILFIVGSDDVRNDQRFLQVASWDGKVFDYYAVEDINGNSRKRAWTFQANSYDAFTDGASYDMSYLGPFNGHVNGACIMKELHDPWYHWHTGRNLQGCLSQHQKDVLKSLPYLSTFTLFSKATKADTLEFEIIVPLLQRWFALLANRDFATLDDQGLMQPKTQPANLHRWMAHLLLTTTVNIATGLSVQAFSADVEGRSVALPWRAPKDLFINFELLARNRFNAFNKPLASFSPEYSGDDYKTAVRSLRLSLLQEWPSGENPPANVPVVQLKKGTLGGGKQTDSYDITMFLEVATNTEGDDIQFVALQTSLEDVLGVLNLPSGLVSDRLLRSILMLDFYNPVYSWKRGVLMQYLPESTNLVDGTYDLETEFVKNVRASPYATQDDSPEHEFLALYDDDAKLSDQQIEARLRTYLSNVNTRLGDVDGLTNFLKLAESRRRIYRPLPLDEFGMTLPYAIQLETTWKLIEMKEDATVQEIPERGLKFLNCWTGTLHGYDPHLLPQESCFPQARAGRCPRRYGGCPLI